MPISRAMERSVLPAGKSAAFPWSTNVTRGILSRRFYGTVRHIGTAHQRGRLDVPEPESERCAAEVGELFRSVVAADRMMVAGRGEILPHREDPPAGFAEIARDGEALLLALAEPQHDARLRHHALLGRP